MKKLSIFAALVVAMGAVSCVEDINNDAPAVNGGAVTFEASFGAMSKAVLEPGADESKVAWEAGDQVSVLAGENNWLYTAASSGYSTTLATEATDVPAESAFYAVYPYDAEATLAEGVISTTLPAEQTAVLGSFSTHLAVAQASGTKLAFKNVCGLVKVTVDAENVTKIVFEGNNSEVVAGGVAVTVADAPTWVAVAEQGATSVTLAPSEGTLAKGAYYFAVLPQTFENGFKVTAYKGAEASVIRNVADEYTLERADIVGGRAFGIDGEGTEASPYILKTAQDMVDMRSLATEGGETWFKMANDIDMKDAKGYLPVNYDNGFTRKIHFDGNDKTISNFSYDKSEDGGNYASLFGVLYGSVKNLKVDNANIISSNACGVIGGYVGTTGKPGHVENVTVTNSSITGSGDRAAGIAGQAVNSTFKNVSFQGTVTSTIAKSTTNNDGVFNAASANAGGFVGLSTGESTYTECSTDVTVTANDSDFAGFAGHVQGTVTFTDCSAKAIVNSKQNQKNRCAAFVGYSEAVATYTRCSVLEGSQVNDVSELTNNRLMHVGGFMGYAGGTSVTADGCSVNVKMNCPKGQTVGGFVGNAGTGVFKASNCSVAGEIIGNNQVAGFIAYQENAASVEISTSYSTAPVTGGGHYTSGFAGYLVNVADKPIKMTDCYATGNVTSTGSSCAGFLGRSENNVELSGCYATGDISAANNVAGILAYHNSGTATLTNCHYDGETITAKGSAGGIVGTNNTGATVVLTGCYSSGSLSATASHIAGILGAASGASHTFTDCYTTMDVYTTGGTNVGAIVGSGVGAISMTNCYAECDIESDYTTDNNGRVGGLVGRHQSDITMTGCRYKGTVKGKFYVGGLIGYSEGKTATISKCNTEGTLIGCTDDQAFGRYHGGFIGAASGANSEVSIANSWSAMSVYGEQFIGGMIGSFEGSKGLTVQKCYTNGTVRGRGIGGIVGRVTQAATITKCIVWDATMTSTRTANSQYASGPITGSVTVAVNFSSCYRNPSMVYTDSYVPAVDHADVVNAKPAAPAVGTVDNNQYAYHGKAATGSTISSVAKTIGWDETIWDLSKDVPTLK